MLNLIQLCQWLRKISDEIQSTYYKQSKLTKYEHLIWDPAFNSICREMTADLTSHINIFLVAPEYLQLKCSREWPLANENEWEKI